MNQHVDWYPLTFRPVYKDYIWGGDRIIRHFHRAEPPGIYAESWEVSTRPEGMSIVSHGPLAGQSLADLIAAHGSAILGTRIPNDRFPLLVKLIDSRQRLSVQVHPDDVSAATYGGEAKTEAWHVLAADPDAKVYAGLKPGVDRAAFEAVARDARVESLLGTTPVAPGDTIFIPGGCVHALDAGLLILEVQQNSNTTYRLYDWGRLGHDGRPRETHVAQALRVIRWKDEDSPKTEPKPLPAEPPNRRALLVESPYFRLEQLALAGPHLEAGDGGSFQVFFVAAGAPRFAWPEGTECFPAGTSVFVPAALREIRIEPGADGTTLLRITVP